LPEVSIRAFADNAAEPKVRGYLHIPETPNGNALILTHGAGSNAQAPLLVALAETFSKSGFTILRCDLPYRQARSYGPPGPADAARDRAGLKNAIAAIKKILDGDYSRDQTSGAPPLSRSLRQGGDFDSRQRKLRIFLSGHSYGGRQCSVLCAELSKQEPDLVAGLLLLSYPLHPPRKPEQQRTQHLPDLRTPTLFVSGTRDPFGSIEELGRAIKMIPAKTKLVAIEGAGHDLGFQGKGKQEALTQQIFTDTVDFFALSS